MKLDIVKGKVALCDVPVSQSRYIERLFDGMCNGDVSTIQIHPRSVFAAKSFYREGIEVSDRLRLWLNKQMKTEAIRGRLSKFLHAHQKRVIERILVEGYYHNRGHGAFIDAGGGKTLIPFELAKQVGRTLVIAEPLLVSDAYVPDHKRFYHYLHMADTTGTSKDIEKRRAILRSDADIYIVSPHVLGSAISEIIDKPWAAILVDESAMIRNPNRTLSRTLHDLAPYFQFRSVMTANPAPKSVHEYWSQIHFLGFDILGDWGTFAKEYSSGTTRFKPYWVFNDKKKNEKLIERISPFVTYASQDEIWQNAPQKRFIIRPVRIKGKQATEYNSLLANMKMRVSSNNLIEVSSRVEMLMKLREITAGFVYDHRGKAHAIGDAKMRELKRILYAPEKKGIPSCKGEQVVIWTTFSEEYSMIEGALKKWGESYSLLAGQDRESRQALRDFKNGKSRILVTHPKTAGHGIRLSNCRNAIYYTIDYDYESWWQSLKRIHRPPQTQETRFYFIIARNTVDEDAYTALSKKLDFKVMCERILERTAKESILA